MYTNKKNEITKPLNNNILQIKCIVMPVLSEDRNNVILQVTTVLKNNILFSTQFFYYQFLFFRLLSFIRLLTIVLHYVFTKKMFWNIKQYIGLA